MEHDILLRYGDFTSLTDRLFVGLTGLLGDVGVLLLGLTDLLFPGLTQRVNGEIGSDVGGETDDVGWPSSG